jgi:hypothetical protein
VTLVQTLQEGYFGKLDEKQREILGRIMKKAEYLLMPGIICVGLLTV